MHQIKKFKNLKIYLTQFGKIELEEKIIDESIRLYFTLKKILINKNYKIAAVKCMDEMINNCSYFCLKNSILNYKGYTISCEVEIYGL
jgi:hypothetical protein